MEPDEEALRRDLNGLPFRIGAAKGKWTLRGLRFPHAYFFITAAMRPGGPPGFLMRSDCKGYSAIAPTSQLWHGGNDNVLDQAHRPRADNDVMPAFKNWGNCLYHPIDRLARSHFLSSDEGMIWTPDKDITFLLETVHGLVHSAAYTGANLPDAALAMPTSLLETRTPRAA